MLAARGSPPPMKMERFGSQTGPLLDDPDRLDISSRTPWGAEKLCIFLMRTSSKGRDALDPDPEETEPKMELVGSVSNIGLLNLPAGVLELSARASP